MLLPSSFETLTLQLAQMVSPDLPRPDSWARASATVIGTPLNRSGSTVRLHAAGRRVSGAALRGGVERAAHLHCNALQGAGAHADFLGDFNNAFPGSQLSLDALFNGLASKASKPPAPDALSFLTNSARHFSMAALIRGRPSERYGRTSRSRSRATSMPSWARSARTLSCFLRAKLRREPFDHIEAF